MPIKVFPKESISFIADVRLCKFDSKSRWTKPDPWLIGISPLEIIFQGILKLLVEVTQWLCYGVQLCTCMHSSSILSCLFTVPVVDLSDSGLSSALSQADPCCWSMCQYVTTNGFFRICLKAFKTSEEKGGMLRANVWCIYLQKGWIISNIMWSEPLPHGGLFRRCVKGKRTNS